MSSSPLRQRLLVLELWGLGDLTFATSLLRAAVEEWDVTLVGKPHARALLEPTFPQIEYLDWEAPWTAFRGKYRLHRWPWRSLAALVQTLRRRRFDAAVSVRVDPRDHLLLRLAGARRVYGFPWRRAPFLLTDRVTPSRSKQHRVEDWQDLAAALGLPRLEPLLQHERYHSPRIDELLRGITKPLVCLHAGARIAVRRWPETYFAELLAHLRGKFDFHLALVPDLDGYGQGLTPLADTVIPSLTLPELVDLLGRVDLLLCNDSGPAHLAATCGRPTIPIFGPTDPDWFRPWGPQQKVIIRDLCPLRPCFDYCIYPEPYCLTKLTPAEAAPEIERQIRTLISSGALKMS